MLRPSARWILCGVLALPVGFAIGYALDARIPANANVLEKSPQKEEIAIEKASAPKPEKIATREPEQPTPPPVAEPPPPKAATPSVKPDPSVTKDEPPGKKRGPATAKSNTPRLDFDQGSVSFGDDKVKVRTPYGNFSFRL